MNAIEMVRATLPFAAMAMSVIALVLALSWSGKAKRLADVSRRLDAAGLAWRQAAERDREEDMRATMLKALREESLRRGFGQGEREEATEPPSPSPQPEEERLRAEVHAWLERFVPQVRAWANYAAVSAGALPGMQVLQRAAADLAGPADAAVLSEVEEKIRKSLPALLTQVISTTDREWSRRSAETNLSLRELSQAIVASCGYSTIDPAPGVPLHTGQHATLQFQTAETASQRGSVAGVLCRGLLSPGGELLQKAEIVEYD